MTIRRTPPVENVARRPGYHFAGAKGWRDALLLEGPTDDYLTIVSNLVVVFQLRIVMLLYTGRWISFGRWLCAALLVSLWK